MQDSRNIFLVGLMGAGKTTVARQLARRLGKTFYDTDHEIERRTGVRVQVIFEIEGEPGFRAREAQMVDSLTALQDVVLGTGGGVVLKPENRALLAARGFVIYLRAQPRDLYQRTRHDKSRPLLATDDPLREARGAAPRARPALPRSRRPGRRHRPPERRRAGRRNC